MPSNHPELKPPQRPAGIPGSPLSGPYPVGEYAAALKERLRNFQRVQLFGEVWNLRHGRAKVYFELRDPHGALPCSIWRNEFEKLGLSKEGLSDGSQVVLGGGCDYYTGSATASPAFSFDVTDLRVAGEGDLLAQLERLRKTFAQEGLFEPQKLLHRKALPHTIGVVTAATGKARDDLIAALSRRGWAGRVVWAFAAVQDRHAAPQISAALQELAATETVDVIVVARGGGSLADLFAFCDETLCRTVALLPVPVIASVGHHTDRTLIDDVAAVSCSTPTHAAEAAVPVDVTKAIRELAGTAKRIAGHGRRATVDRARYLVSLARAPADHLDRERGRLHQLLREIRASARRNTLDEQSHTERFLTVLTRKRTATARELVRLSTAAKGHTERLRELAEGRFALHSKDLARLLSAVDAHDPERTLKRGYALVQDSAGELITSAAAAEQAATVRVRFHDGEVPMATQRKTQ